MFLALRRIVLANRIHQRLSAKTNLNLAKLWLDRKEYGRLAKVRFLPTPPSSAVHLLYS